MSSSVVANAATPNAATPSSSAAAVATSSSAAAVAATSSSAAVAQSTTSAIAAVAASSSAAPAAASSSSAVASSSSSIAASSSASSSRASSSAASSSISSSISSIASSSAKSSSSSSSAASTTLAGASGSSTTSGSSGLSAGTIGAIVGGAVGGVVLLALLWTCWRRRRDRKDRIAPPPPRDPAMPGPVMSTRSRLSSNHMATRPTRASSYSTLLAQARPSSQYASHSRSPSYYTTYPIASPSTGPIDSPSLPSSTTSDSPPLTATTTPAMKPTLPPLITSLRRGDSSSSGERDRASYREFGERERPRHKSSVDRLRYEATYPGAGGSSGNSTNSAPISGANSDRAPSPSNSHIPSEADDGPSQTSRTASPHPSTLNGYPSPSSLSRQSFAPPFADLHPNQYPRPMSMTSISSHAPSMSGSMSMGMGGRYLRPSGAPHSGRAIQLEMPKLLGARPDANGDFFAGQGRFDSGFSVPFDQGQGQGHARRQSRQMVDDFAPRDHRLPSTQSSRSNLNNSTLPHRSSSNAGSSSLASMTPSGSGSDRDKDRGVVEMVVGSKGPGR